MRASACGPGGRGLPGPVRPARRGVVLCSERESQPVVNAGSLY